MSQNSYIVTNVNGPQLLITPEFVETVRCIVLNMAEKYNFKELLWTIHILNIANPCQ